MDEGLREKWVLINEKPDEGIREREKIGNCWSKELKINRKVN